MGTDVLKNVSSPGGIHPANMVILARFKSNSYPVYDIELPFNSFEDKSWENMFMFNK